MNYHFSERPKNLTCALSFLDLSVFSTSLASEENYQSSLPKHEFREALLSQQFSPRLFLFCTSLRDAGISPDRVKQNPPQWSGVCGTGLAGGDGVFMIAVSSSFVNSSHAFIIEEHLDTGEARSGSCVENRNERSSSFQRHPDHGDGLTESHRPQWIQDPLPQQPEEY